MASALSSRSKAASASSAARDAKGGAGGAAAAPAPLPSSSEGGRCALAAATAAVEACPCENCQAMRASPCREEYVKNYYCTKVALDASLHPDHLCSEVAADLDKCIDANRAYYRLLDSAKEI